MNKQKRLFKCNSCNGFCQKNEHFRLCGDIIWTEIPKNASSYIKTYVYPDYEFIKPYDAQNDNDKKFIVVYRDPIERFKSTCAHYFLDGYRKLEGKKWVEQHKIRNMTKNNIAEIVINNFEKLESIHAPHHWEKQSYYVPNWIFEKDVDFVNIRNISSYFGTTRKRDNVTSSFEIVINKKVENFIKDIYSSDFDLIKNIQKRNQLCYT